MRAWKPAVAAIAVTVAATGCTTIVRSSVSSGGTAQNLAGQALGTRTLSDTGRYVAFESPATNLVANDTNVAVDVFRHDNQTGSTVRVSVNGAGAQIPADSRRSAISGDGDHVAFVTTATLEPADQNTKEDVYVRTVSTGTTERVSIRPDGTPVVRPDIFSAVVDLSLSRDGRFVAMRNSGPGFGEIFIRDRTADTTKTSVGPAGFLEITSDASAYVWNVLCTGGPCPYISIVQPIDGSESVTIEHECGFTALGASDDARFVVGNRFGVYPMFECPQPTGLVRWDRTTRTFTPVPIDAFLETSASISDNGRFVAAIDQNTGSAMVADLNTGEVQVASADALGHPRPEGPTGAALSGSGRYLAFSTAGKLVPEDTDDREDVFTRYAIQPTVSAAAPASLARGASHVNVTLTGVEMLSGPGVAVSGSGITVHSVTHVSTTTVKVNLSVAADAGVGPRDVLVSNRGGFGHSDAVCSGCLTVS